MSAIATNGEIGGGNKLHIDVTFFHLNFIDDILKIRRNLLRNESHFRARIWWVNWSYLRYRQCNQRVVKCSRFLPVDSGSDEKLRRGRYR